MIGREKEASELMKLYYRKKAELVAVYGRRRVGKTYLIDETFRGKITFRHAGLSPVEENKRGFLKAQLEHFYYSLLIQGMKKSHRPESWLEAFYMLESFLEERDDGERQVVFLDELPWLDSPRSGFMTAFEGFWNTWGCHRNNLMVIVCGSASSWMKDSLINNHGGLYNRVTYVIKLSPFTLRECELFFTEANVRMSRYDIVQSYMALGGIPYYLGYFESGLSLAQNMDRLFFSRQAKLREEYDRLFTSMFDSPEYVRAIVELLYTKNAGFTRKEMIKRLGIQDGSRLSESLHALIASDFVVKYVPFGFSKREEHYKLIDPFCLFWLHFIKGKHVTDEHYWSNSQFSQSIVSWRGFAFEQVCFNHIEPIKRALGISGVKTMQSAWSKKDDDAEGTQIDLLIDRSDNVLNCCEIKFYSTDFAVDKEYYRVMLRRQEMLSKEVSSKVSIQSVLITTFGLAHNEYDGCFSNVITLKHLFE